MKLNSARAVTAAILAAVLALALSAPTLAAPKPENQNVADNPSAITAKNGLLMDQTSGRLLWAKEADQVVVPASLTKLMTLNLIFEALDSGKVRLQDLVPISERAWKTGGSRMFLRVDTKVPLEEIIKGIAVASGNDACVAAAEFIGGTVENFVAMMNKRAQEMGLSKTRFVDPHGLSDENRISARDIANLARLYLRDHPKSLSYHSLKQFTFIPAGGKPITQQNRNRLLGVYDGADGLKTGHTDAAGYNLVATAERNGTRFIGVVLGVQAKTEPLGEELRAKEIAKLLDYGFATYQTRTLVQKGEKLGEIRVYKGASDIVYAVAAQEVKYTTEKNNANLGVTKRATLESRLVAPVKKGQVVGKAAILLGTQEVETVQLLAADDVQPGSLWKRIVDSIRLLFQRTVKFE